MSFGLESKGERGVALRFETFPESIRQQLKDRITQSIQQLATAVRGKVPKRTGRLASEVQSYVDETPERIIGRVKIIGDGAQDYAKAGALEYGAHRAARVKAHTARLTHLFGRQIAPMQVMVEAHNRRPNVDAVSYLRGPFAALADEFLGQMQAVVAAAGDGDTA